MIKKREDGNYYEKKVTWKKNGEPQFFTPFGIGLSGVSLGMLFGLIAGAEPKLFWIMLGMVVASILCFVGGYYETHNKKVKYKRIGK